MENERKTILVTGASRGIGEEVCRQMSSRGWRVIVAARNGDQARQLAAELGNDSFGVSLDVRFMESVEAALKAVKSNVSHLDVLVNNAGIIGNAPMMAFNMEEISTTLDTNLMGPLRVTQAFLPLLQASGEARVINVSSGMGELASLRSGGYGAYRLSKASLNAFTILLAAETGKAIKVVAVCPGWVRTDMGGRSAPRSVEKGAETITWLATESGIVSGKFYRDKQVIPW